MSQQIHEDQAEHAYWQFDARRKGYAEWRGSPQSERDAFKAEYRAAIAMQAEAPAAPVQTAEKLQSIADELEDAAAPYGGDFVDTVSGCVEALREMSAPVQTEEMVRFCPHCASIGEIGAEYRDCCPDGSAARHIPRKLAEVCRDTFKLAISAVAAPVQAEQAQAEPVRGAFLNTQGGVTLCQNGQEKTCFGFKGYLYAALPAQAERAAAVRAAALEEAAKLCDEKFERRAADNLAREASTARSLATAIRALIAPSTGESKGEEE